MKSIKTLLAFLPIFLPIIGQAKTANQVYRMPSSGNIASWGAINLASSAAVTGLLSQLNFGARNFALSSNVSSFSTASTSFTDVTGLTVTLTTTNTRPVSIRIVNGNQNFASTTLIYCTSSVNTGIVYARMERDGTEIGSYEMAYCHPTTLDISPVTSLELIDSAPTAASHTYKIQTRVNAGTTTANFNNVKLVAFEN